ncbi:MAG TPA: nucleoside deaminase [Clostridiales bacterium]|jgi:tRNA(adenine34) deaminase|nr:nucleoside deaminase [Clostridiales bacterium]
MKKEKRISAEAADEDIKWMELAIREAEKAMAEGEVPVGCVIVKDGELIAAAHNRRESDRRATAHAEHDAIELACEKLGGWRLSGACVYVTLEPCPMCAGAIINAQVSRVVYGAKDSSAGAFGSVVDLRNYPLYKPEVKGGVMAERCSALLSDFFSRLRLMRGKNRYNKNKS